VTAAAAAAAAASMPAAPHESFGASGGEGPPSDQERTNGD